MKTTKTIFLAFTLNSSAYADYYRALSDELLRRGYQVVIITDGKRTHKVSENTNPAIYTWPSNRPTKLTDAYFLFKLIQQWRPVISFSIFGAVNVNLVVSWLLKVPLRFVTYRTMLDRESALQPRAKTGQWQLLRKRLVYQLASLILPNADAMKTELMEIYHVPSDKIKVFHNAIAIRPEIIQPSESTQPNLISAGGLTRGKRHDVLINAMAIVHKTNPDVHLTIYGEGSERARLEALIQSLGLTDVVKLPGKISHDDIMRIMAGSYGLIHPSRFEAFGYSVIESFSVGTPVIASAVGGIPEIIREGVDGFLVPPDEPIILAERIIRLCSDPQMRYEMSQNCQARFMEAFELNNAVQKQTDWFEQKINQFDHKDVVARGTR